MPGWHGVCGAIWAWGGQWLRFCQGLRHRGEETGLNSEGADAGTSLSDP